MSARRQIIPVFVPHRGCPNQCVFCDQRKISGSKSDISPEHVAKEIESACRRVPGKGNRQLAFYGGSFTAIPAELQNTLLKTAYGFIVSGEIDSIRLSTRPDAIDPDCLARLRLYGVTTIEIGAQSMDDDVLRRSGRGHTSEDVCKAAEMIREAGFELIIQMMTGLPGDTAERSVETARKICDLRPDGVRIYPTVILRDTPLSDLWKSGLYREHTLEDAVAVCAEIVPIFERNGIAVIRLGLNPTEDLSAGEAIGGAYHPALGELVRSRIRCREMEELLEDVPEGSIVKIRVPAAGLSQYIGQHRENIRILKTRFRLTGLKIEGCEQGGLSFQVAQAGACSE